MIQITVGNLMSWADNMPTAVASHIRQEFFYYVPGYERTQAFRDGWDGKRYLLFPDGQDRWRFPTGLLNRLLRWLYDRKIPYHVPHDLGSVTPDLQMDYLKQHGFQVFPFQVEAAVAATAKPPVGRTGGVLRMATGSGKTVVASKVLQMQRVPTIIFVNTKDLLDQWYEELSTTIKCPIGRVGDGHCDVRDITVATVQTTCRAFGIVSTDKSREKAVTVDLTAFKHFVTDRVCTVVADECHAVAADTVYECLFLCRNALSVIGLSASPWRDDGTDLLIEAACGPVVYIKTASDLIEEINPLTGRPYLVPPVITAYDLPEPLVQTPAHVDTGVPHEFYKAWIIDNPDRNVFVAKLALQDTADGRVVLILVKRLEHGKLLEALIPGSQFVEGKNRTKVRKAAYEGARTGQIRCLIATTLADQGLDLPLVSSLILAGAGRSSTKALQRIGRVIRDHLTKTNARVHDLIDAHFNFKSQYQGRERIYNTERRFVVSRVRVTREQMTM